MIDINYIAKKNKLTPLESEILIFIYENISNKNLISIRNVAKENFTSTSVIYAFIKKMNYTSYSDFLYFLKNQKKEYINIDIFNLKNNPQFNEALSLLIKHKNNLIMFSSTGIANNISSYMNEKLALCGIRSISNCHLQLLDQSLKKDILLIIISESGETLSVTDIAEFANVNSIDTITFTSKGDSKIGNLSKVSFQLDQTIFFSQVLYIFDILITKL